MEPLNSDTREIPMSRIHRRSTKAELRLETLEGRIALTHGMASPLNLPAIAVDSGHTHSGISQGQLHSLKQFEKIQNATKAEKFLVNHPKFGAWYTLNVLNRTQPTGTSSTGQTGTLPGQIVTDPKGQPIAAVFGTGNTPSGSSNATSPNDSSGSTGTTTGGTSDSPSDPKGTLPGHTVPGPNGQPIAIVFGSGSSGSANTTSTSDSAGSTGTTTDNSNDSQGTLPGHIVTGPHNQPIAAVF
jgi:hypothetical protein